MKDTIAKRKADMESQRAQLLARFEFEARILSELPETLPVPTIANESDRAFFDQPGAWVSWHRSYGESHNAEDILKALEDAGFKALPITLCKWDQYRRTAEPGAQDSIPEKKHRYTLTDSEPIAPLYVTPSQHTECDVTAFYRSPSGLILKVSVSASELGVTLTARRIASPGEWRYEHGSARILFPQEFHSVETASGEVVAQLLQPAAYVDTEHGISGTLYWSPAAHEQDEFPLTPSQFLSQLKASRKRA